MCFCHQTVLCCCCVLHDVLSSKVGSDYKKYVGITGTISLVKILSMKPVHSEVSEITRKGTVLLHIYIYNAVSAANESPLTIIVFGWRQKSLLDTT